MRRNKAKFQVGQIVHAWKGIRLFKIAERKYRKKGDKFDGWWYSDSEEQEFHERECKPLTRRERGGV